LILNNPGSNVEGLMLINDIIRDITEYCVDKKDRPSWSHHGRVEINYNSKRIADVIVILFNYLKLTSIEEDLIQGQMNLCLLLNAFPADVFS